MDFSKLNDTQRQELQQLQQQFQEHQAQQQKQQEESAAAAAASAAAAVQQPPPAYDPSQVHQSYDPSQGYDQSYYYNYNYQDPSQQQQQPPPPQQQYDPAYYQADYSNTYQQQQPYAHPESSSAAAYTVPSEQQRNEGSGSAPLGLGQVQLQNPYVDPNNQVNLGGTQPNPGYPVPPGLNAAAAAAVAALSQLTQFAGSMGAAERAMGGGYAPPPNAGGGHYGQVPFRPPVGHPPFRGGGRRGGGTFRGGGRGNFGNRPPITGGSGPPFQGRGRGRGRGRGGRPPFGASSSHPESSAGEVAKPTEGAESTAQPNVQPPTRIAWCELCRVDCTSKEILEQHKNGKRHKKNLQKLQDIKSAYQPGTDEKPGSDVHKNAVESETKDGSEGNDNQETKPWMKRKMRGGGRGGGRGAKRLRQAATGPPNPKVVIPLMCDLCNVKCDTQEVFDRHVAGKKHIAKLKRFEGHQAIYGPTAVQALYPPNPLAQTLAPQPSSYPPPEAYVPVPAQNPNPQLADAPLEFGTQNAAPASTPAQ